MLTPHIFNKLVNASSSIHQDQLTLVPFLAAPPLQTEGCKQEYWHRSLVDRSMWRILLQPTGLWQCKEMKRLWMEHIGYYVWIPGHGTLSSFLAYQLAFLLWGVSVCSILISGFPMKVYFNLSQLQYKTKGNCEHFFNMQLYWLRTKRYQTPTKDQPGLGAPE